MGTNYYLKTDKCKTCGHKEEGIHLGKSSAGWQFSFQYNGGQYYKSVEEMKVWTKDKKIENEYGEDVSYKEFWDMVKTKQIKKNLNHAEQVKGKEHDNGNDFVIDGYSFSDQQFC